MFKEGDEVIVTSCFLVSFSIRGKYHGNAWYSVVPMDVCQIVRPWQYDHHTIHDGYKNAFTSVKNNVNIVLGST